MTRFSTRIVVLFAVICMIIVNNNISINIIGIIIIILAWVGSPAGGDIFC